MVEPLARDPDLDGVALQRQEAEAERVGRSFGRNRHTIEHRRGPCRVDVTGCPPTGKRKGDAESRDGTFERLLAGSTWVALHDRRVTPEE
jgi:hypothetical protein